MKKLIVLALILIPALAFADGGGKNQQIKGSGSPLLDENGDVIGVVFVDSSSVCQTQTFNTGTITLCEAPQTEEDD